MTLECRCAYRARNIEGKSFMALVAGQSPQRRLNREWLRGFPPPADRWGARRRLAPYEPATLPLNIRWRAPHVTGDQAAAVEKTRDDRRASDQSNAKARVSILRRVRSSRA